MMFEHIDRLLERNDFVNHRVKASSDKFLRYSRPFSEYGYQLRSSVCWLIIDLDQGLEVHRLEHEQVQAVKHPQARENAVMVRERSLEGDTLDTFYKTYQQAMDRVGRTAYPYAFLEQLGEKMADRIELFTVEIDGEFTARQLYLLDDEQSSVRYFFQAVDEEYFDYHPSELLDEYEMKWAIEREYGEYDLGSSPSDFTDGSF